MYKGVIFDFNGTLFFDDDKHVLAWNKISMMLRGRYVDKDELYNQFHGTPNHENILYLTNNKVSEEEVQKYSLLKEKYYREYCQKDTLNFHLVNGAKEYFDYLRKKGIPFTIASASIKENIDFFIESFHLEKWIDPQTIVYDNGCYQNKIQMFKDASHHLGVNICDIRVYEDSLSGIQCAYEAGVREIVVVCQEDQKEKFMKLPGVVDTICNFENVFSR